MFYAVNTTNLFIKKKGGISKIWMPCIDVHVHVRRNEVSLSCEKVDQILENDFMLKTWLSTFSMDFCFVDLVVVKINNKQQKLSPFDCSSWSM